MEFDVVIVGAGPAGLTTAIQLGKLNQQKGLGLNICVVEKGAEVGAHILSGAVLEPAALTEIIPDWKQKNAPVSVEVTSDTFYYLSAKNYHRFPTPKVMQNHGNYIISLSELCRWMANYAEQLGVNIFPGFAASEILYDKSNGAVIGVQTGDMGLNKERQPTERFQAGMDLLAKQTVFAEGCRGSLTQKLIAKFNLAKKPQSYAIGVKELWKIPSKMHELGKVVHTLGWPLSSDTYGGGFIYHFKENLLALGLVIGLDYKNPYLDPFKELQCLKLHPLIKPLLENSECISFGARALNEGGLQGLPRLVVPGGLLVGCSAGMVNVGKIKGIHNALRSGMLAANALVEQLPTIKQIALNNYQTAVEHSPIYQELYKVRNLRPGFHRGLWPGLVYAFLDQYVFFGHAPWTLQFKSDYLALKLKSAVKPINYPKPDGKITFDKPTQVYLTRTKHREDEPCHLLVPNLPIMLEINYTKYAAPETRYCPSGVYEYIEKDNKLQLQINSTNCIHCKTCDIKDPTQNIVWQVPEGGEGPHYSLM